MTGVTAAVPDVLVTCTSRSGLWDPCPITPISSEILSRLLSAAQEGRLAWSSASPSPRPWVPKVPECVCTLLPITCTNSIRKHLSTPSLFTFKGLNSLFTGLSTIPGPNGEESPVQFCAAWSLVFPGLFLSLSCNIHDNRVGLFFFFRGSVGLNLRGHFKPGKAFISVNLKEPWEGPSPQNPLQRVTAVSKGFKCGGCDQYFHHVLIDWHEHLCLKDRGKSDADFP